MSHFLIGAAGVMAFTSGPIISALWFPANQRGTATAVTTIAGYTGGAVCFLFGCFCAVFVVICGLFGSCYLCFIWLLLFVVYLVVVIFLIDFRSVF